MINFFLYCIKRMSFSSSPKGTPHDRCRRTMKQKLLVVCNENQWNWVVLAFALALFMHSKIIPQIFLPQIFWVFFSVHTRRVEIGHILCSRSWLYMHCICICICRCRYMYMYRYRYSVLLQPEQRGLLHQEWGYKPEGAEPMGSWWASSFP